MKKHLVAAVAFLAALSPASQASVSTEKSTPQTVKQVKTEQVKTEEQDAQVCYIGMDNRGGLGSVGKALNYLSIITAIVGDIPSLANAFGITIDVSPILNAFNQVRIIGNDAYSYVETVYQDVASIYPALKFPPDFSVGLADYIKLGKQVKKTYNDVVAPLQNLDATGVNEPNQALRLYCLQNQGAPECKDVGITDVYSTSDFIGATNRQFENNTSVQIAGKISDNVETIAATSMGDQIDDDKQEQELRKAFSQRNVFMNGAALSYSTVPLGKEYAEKLPPEVRKQYNFVATQQLAKEVYIKSLQRRLQIHYQKILALKKLVNRVCSASANTSPPTCASGGGSGEVSLNGSSVLDQNGVQYSMLENENGSVGTRFHCFAWEAAAHVISSLGARITAAEMAIVSTLNLDTAVISQSVTGSVFANGCATRIRLWQEENANRNLVKSLMCAQMRIELEQLMLQLDTLEAQTATATGVFTQIQNQNYKGMERELQKVEERGYELMR